MPSTDQPTAAPADASLDVHFQKVARKMLNGIVVPLLGAGVNLSGRPKDDDFRWDNELHRFLPSGKELASWLVEHFDYYPELKQIDDLLRVSQFLELKEGGELYQRLHDLFDADYPPSPLHTFLAELQPLLREHGRGPQVILTTNYDDALERAFVQRGEPYDLITYVCTSPVDLRGRFTHFPPDTDEPVPILTPNEYQGLDLKKRAVILKMHIAGLLPKPIPAKLRNSHFLFLGYGMADWNLRVILRRIWGEQAFDYPSWSIQLGPDELERAFWGDRKVEILERDLDEYVTNLRAALDQQLAAGAQ